MLLLTYTMILDHLRYSFSIHGIVSIQSWQSLIPDAEAKMNESLSKKSFCNGNQKQFL